MGIALTIMFNIVFGFLLGYTWNYMKELKQISQCSEELKLMILFFGVIVFLNILYKVFCLFREKRKCRC